MRRCGSTDIGQCSYGYEVCVAGNFTGCTAVKPQPELCDGLDNDCNGIVDDIAPQSCGVSSVGVCKLGYRTCAAGRWSDCIGNVDPINELCDGLDNDCDGLVDEGNVCDKDSDGVVNKDDNCPDTANPDQADIDRDGFGDACDLDDDNDGVRDSEDVCPADGRAYYQGCPNGIKAIAVNHTVIYAPNNPPSTKTPLAGLDVRVYRRADIEAKGITPINWKSYGAIVANVSALSRCTTNSSGICIAGVPGPDSYVVIGVLDNLTDKHLGSSVDSTDPNLRVVGGVVTKHLQLITLDKNGSQTSLPARTIAINGSTLYIVEPEYVLWNSTSEGYPFVFEADSYWKINVSLYVPAGYTTDVPYIIDVADNSTEAILFVVLETGSKPGDVDVEYNLEHKGKKQRHHSKIGAKMTPHLARKKAGVMRRITAAITGRPI